MGVGVGCAIGMTGANLMAGLWLGGGRQDHEAGLMVFPLPAGERAG